MASDPAQDMADAFGISRLAPRRFRLWVQRETLRQIDAVGT